ncbi:MAG: DUF3617 family protein [Candidatus Nitrotoga sp.]
MKNFLYILMCAGAIAPNLLVNNVHAASDELWEMSVKTEMDDAPFPTPPHITQLCLANGALDPNRLQAKDEDCAITNVQHTGNKVTWKYKCVTKKETMEGSGEATKTRNAIIGVTKLSGLVGREIVGLTISYSGKRTKKKCAIDNP